MVLPETLQRWKLGNDYKCAKMAAIIFAVAAWQAVLLCLLFAVIYVGSLYVWGATTRKDRYEIQRSSQRPFSLYASQ